MSNYKQNILAPFNYIFTQKGKNIRNKFVDAISDWYNVQPEVVEKIALLWEKLHNASLVIDDIEDNSELRRGRPAAHIQFGIPMSINAANYVYFEVLGDLMELGRMEVIKIFTEQMLTLHHGQGMDLYWRDRYEFKTLDGILDNNALIWNDETETSAIFPLEKDYCDVIVKKTSGQFVFFLRLMNELSSNPDKMNTTRLAELIGLCFQIRDDLMNLVSTDYKDAKGFCEDISEGKLSLPVIHALNKKSFSRERRQRLWDILRMKTNDVEVKEEALNILEDSGAIQYTEELLVRLKLDIKQEIEKLGGNSKLDSMLKNFWG